MIQHIRAILFWFILLVALFAGLGLIAGSARAGEVGVFGAHWSHHWVSKNITNEKHALAAIRLDSFVAGRFYNSFKQPGFSGETVFIGMVKDWRLTDPLNQYGGHVIGRGSVGLNYGYTRFYGHEPGADKKVLPYIAGGLFYRQSFGYQGEAYWEAGALQFGDDTLPSAGIGTRF